MHFSACAFVFCLLMLVYLQIAAATESPYTQELHCAAMPLERDLADFAGAPIRAIEVRAEDVFDLTAKQVYWFHRLANRTHTITTEATILDDVLFQAGETLNPIVLLETERLLRTRRYLRHVEVSVSALCPDGSVNVLIHTWDNWSLLPNLSFSHEGGESEIELGVSEDNLFGSGNQISFDYEKDSERHSYIASFRSPNLYGSHWGFSTRYADKSDGKSYLLALERPFYRIQAPWAFAVSYNKDNEHVNEYYLGDEINEYLRKWDRSQLSAGWKILASERWAQRMGVGFEKNKAEFFSTSLTTYGQATNRDISQVWLSWALVEDNYQRLYNVHQFNRVEDINFGWQARVQVGALQRWLGAEQSGWTVLVEAGKTWQLSEKNLLLASFSAEHLSQKELKQSLARGASQWIHQLGPQHSLVGQLQYAYGRELFRDQRLILGGDNGLRPYPLHYQTGDRLLLATAEYRYYSTLSFAQIFDVGYAAFTDWGRTWGDNEALPAQPPSQNLYGVGVGIRLLSSHSSRGTIIHLDMTKALRAQHNVSGIEWRMLAKQRF